MKYFFSLIIKVWAIFIVLGFAWGLGQCVKHNMYREFNLKGSDIINIQEFNIDDFYDKVFGS